MKGRKGPKWLRLKIQQFNRKERELRQKGKMLKTSGNLREGRKLITKHRPLDERVKNKVFKRTGTDLLIEKARFPKVFARGSLVASVGLTAKNTVSHITDRLEKNEKIYSGEKLEEMNARSIGEEVNKGAGKVAGATAGGYIGATLGASFGPLGAVAGGIVGAYVGEAVGGWAAKYTKDWASDASAWLEKQTDQVIEEVKATFNDTKDLIEDVTDTVSDVSDKLFGWI